MSRENVEIVRRLLDATIRQLASYWQRPRSIVQMLETGEADPDLREVFVQIHPDVRFTNTMGDVMEGRLAVARGADELLQASRSYSIEVEEITDLGGDTVLGVLRVAMTGQSSGVPAGMSLFTLYRLRDGLIATIDEYLSRHDAFKALGLEE